MAEETLNPEENQQEQAPPEAEPQSQAPAEADEPGEQAEAAPAEQAAADAAEAPAEQSEAEPAEAAGEEAAEEAAEEPGPEIGVQVEDAGTLRKKVTITVPAEMIDAKREEMFGELSTSAQVPGFRIGRAPKRLIVKRFGKEVDRDVRNALIGESLGQGLEKSELNVLGEPDIDLDAIELPESGDMSYEMEVEVAPDFELPELDGIEVSKPAVSVTDERIDEAVERLRLSRASYEAADEPAAAQDVVQVDAKITGDGIDEVARGINLRVAPGQIEGLPLIELGKELAGKKAGDTATMTTKVSDVHPNEDWRGKEATVEIEINEVRKRRLPELDDEFAEARGFESIEDLRQSIAGRMEAQIQLEVSRAMRGQVDEYLLANTDFELPEGVAKRHTARVIQRRYVDLLQMGIPPEQVEERMTELQASIVEQAQRDLKLSFIYQKIAVEQDIEITDEEINASVAQMAAVQRRRPERLRQELESDGTIRQVGVSILEQKAARRLLDNAKITEVTGEEADEAPEQGQAEGDDGEEKPGAEAPEEAPAPEPAADAEDERTEK